MAIDWLLEASFSAVALRDSQLKVARAWALKETAMALWGYRQRGWAERMWRRWYGWAMRSRLEPMKRVARMIKAIYFHLGGLDLYPETLRSAHSKA